MALPALKPNRADVLLTVLDLTGTFVFAVEGALAAVRGNLDFFGLMTVKDVGCPLILSREGLRSRKDLITKRKKSKANVPENERKTKT